MQKHLDPAVKPEHDKSVADQNKQSGPTSADAKPKVLLRPKLPASQITRKRLIDRSIKLLNQPKSQINVPGRTPQLPDQKPVVQKGPNLPNQRPVAQKEPPQRQSDGNTDNTNPSSIVNQPAHDNPIHVRHFEPNPLLEDPQQDKDPQEIVSQHPIHSTGDPNVVQDPFDTQMEVPFTEDTVDPVFKRPEMADFEIPPVLEEMIPDRSLMATTAEGSPIPLPPFSKGKAGKRTAPFAAPEANIEAEEVSEEQIIYINDNAGPSSHQPS